MPLFVQSPEDARRHLEQLIAGLKKAGIGGLALSAVCTALAMFLTRLVSPTAATSGLNGVGSVALVAWWMAGALAFFSVMYIVSSYGLANRKGWARYFAAGAFALKIVLCLWLGRASLAASLLLLSMVILDVYGLWILLGKETGALFAPASAPATNQPAEQQTC